MLSSKNDSSYFYHLIKKWITRWVSKLFLQLIQWYENCLFVNPTVFLETTFFSRTSLPYFQPYIWKSLRGQVWDDHGFTVKAGRFSRDSAGRVVSCPFQCSSNIEPGRWSRGGLASLRPIGRGPCPWRRHLPSRARSISAYQVGAGGEVG